MKTIFRHIQLNQSFCIVLSGAVLLIFVSLCGCTKSEQAKPLTSYPADSTTIRNPAPYVSTDRLLFATTQDSVVLVGYLSSQDHKLVSSSWKKISGPSGATILNPDSLITKVSDFQLGQYEFELTVADDYGRTARAVAKVDVIQPGAHETIFTGLQWSCPMGCSISISNFHSFVAQGIPYRVFVWDNYSASWQQAKPESQWDSIVKFIYGETNNILWIYTDDADGESKIKIQY